ncbi:MAG: hypothetical protein M0Q49_03260 [Porticoccaceae bacterium]|nr:hypothetical protein [Porticoccaceae bacterium]
MSNIDRLLANLDNFYTAQFERGQKIPNRLLIKTITSREEIFVHEGEVGVEWPVPSRVYGPLDITGDWVRYGSGITELDAGGIALWFTPNWDADDGNDHYVLNLEAGAGVVQVLYDGGDQQFVVLRDDGGGVDAARTPVQSFVSGTPIFLSASWPEDELWIADAASFTVEPSTVIPSDPKERYLDLLSVAGSEVLDATLHWLMMSEDGFTPAEVTLLIAQGVVYPDWQDWSRAVPISFLWDGAGVEHDVMSNRVGETTVRV